MLGNNVVLFSSPQTIYHLRHVYAVYTAHTSHTSFKLYIFEGRKIDFCLFENQRAILIHPVPTS